MTKEIPATPAAIGLTDSGDEGEPRSIFRHLVFVIGYSLVIGGSFD
jgi:hypothetical protein